CELGILESLALRQRRSVSFVEVALDVGHRRKLWKGTQRSREFAPNGKSFLCKLDRGLEQFGPGQAPILAMRHVEHGEDTRYPGRKSARDRIEMSARLAVGIKKHLRIRRCRRGFAAIETGDFPGLR